MLRRYAPGETTRAGAERAGLVGGFRAVQQLRPGMEVARSAVVGLLCALALALSAPPALADGDIQDGASIFSPAGAQVALAHIRKIGADTGVDVHVVTVNHLSAGQDVGAAAQAVFDAQRMHGVLLYVSKDDQQLAVHVGADTRSAITLHEQTAIRDAVIAGFRQGDFDGGLLAGIDRIGRDVQDLRIGRGPTINPTAVAPTAARPGAGFSWASVPLVGVVCGLAAFLWVRRRSRSRAHAPAELVAAAVEADRLGVRAGPRPSGVTDAAGVPPERPTDEDLPREPWVPRAGPYEGAQGFEKDQDEEAAEAQRRV